MMKMMTVDEPEDSDSLTKGDWKARNQRLKMKLAKRARKLAESRRKLAMRDGRYYSTTEHVCD